ncbi:hypothetical protein B0F90DRAFT_1621325 [Multifurca ochricompacta]|uniref:Uncharacterized protein n=1 Tax=Multifurca ochricompacta TaxID=376703 RepID=A0AAD4QTY4_9AGAM|nr:hypothetical protein B0F90DRAFT_1621325 [Multifurca ochricompacta]
MTEESTPLILNRSTRTRPSLDYRTVSSSPSLPILTPVVNRVRQHGLQAVDDGDLFPSATTAVEQVSFKLIVLLQLYLLYRAPPSTFGQEVWEQWSKERASSLNSEDLERRAIHLWEEFLEVSRTTGEIEECLWSAYPLEEDKSLNVRGMSPIVVDILKDPKAPPSLLSHRLITLSLLRTWTHGRVLTPAESLSLRVLQRFSSVTTPSRVVHAVDILLQLGYLALLSNYVLYPPERPIVTTGLSSTGTREALLIIYSTASLIRPPPTFLVAPFVLVTGAFFFSLPSTPLPGDTSYSILLGALILHVLLLHLPRTPSPNFLVSPEVTLPLATLLWHEFTRTLYPGILFYLPAAFLASFFLSVALEDSIPHFPTALNLVGPAPMEIRMAFFTLWSILLLLMLASTALLVLFSASLLPISSRMACPWDRYSVAVGLRSRRIFVAAVSGYSVPYYFPPPFNLLQVLFICTPRYLSRQFGWKESPVIEQFEGILWHFTTGLLGFLVAGCCWLWTTMTTSLSLTSFSWNM